MERFIFFVLSSTLMASTAPILPTIIKKIKNKNPNLKLLYIQKLPYTGE
jgi:hypothetical protein